MGFPKVAYTITHTHTHRGIAGIDPRTVTMVQGVKASPREHFRWPEEKKEKRKKKKQNKKKRKDERQEDEEDEMPRKCRTESRGMCGISVSPDERLGHRLPWKAARISYGLYERAFRTSGP